MKKKTVRDVDIKGKRVRNLPAITDPVTIDGYTQPGARPNTLTEGDDRGVAH